MILYQIDANTFSQKFLLENTFVLNANLTLWRPLGFGDFRKKTSKHTWLCEGISPVQYAQQTR